MCPVGAQKVAFPHFMSLQPNIIPLCVLTFSVTCTWFNVVDFFVFWDKDDLLHLTMLVIDFAGV